MYLLEHFITDLNSARLVTHMLKHKFPRLDHVCVSERVHAKINQELTERRISNKFTSEPDNHFIRMFGIMILIDSDLD